MDHRLLISILFFPLLFEAYPVLAKDADPQEDPGLDILKEQIREDHNEIREELVRLRQDHKEFYREFNSILRNGNYILLVAALSLIVLAFKAGKFMTNVQRDIDQIKNHIRGTPPAPPSAPPTDNAITFPDPQI